MLMPVDHQLRAGFGEHQVAEDVVGVMVAVGHIPDGRIGAGPDVAEHPLRVTGQ